MSELSLIESEFDQDDFDFSDLQEELRVDERCRTLLNKFYSYLLDCGVDVQDASDQAFCADYYLRDYLLDFSRQNVVRPKPGIVRSFAGNWFIVRTLDPEISVLAKHLLAISKFYRYLQQQHYISNDELGYLLQESEQTEYYMKRIESFLSIEGDGFTKWDAECPLGV